MRRRRRRRRKGRWKWGLVWVGPPLADSQSRVAWAAAAMHAGVSTESKIYRQPFWKRPTAQVLNYTLPGKPGLICFLIFGFWPKVET